ncbi:hypothetical protein D3C80_780130 [compost metagenome]
MAQVNDSEIVATPDQVGFQVSIAGQVHGNVLGGYVGRYVFKTSPKYLVAFRGNFGHDQSRSGFKANFCNPVGTTWNQAESYHRHAHGNCAVAAHVGVHAAVHVDQAGIVLAARRRGQEHTEHVLVAARLLHQRFTQPVIVLLEKSTLGQNAGTGRVGNAAMHDAQWFAFGMGIDDIERVLHAHNRTPG